MIPDSLMQNSLKPDMTKEEAHARATEMDRMLEAMRQANEYIGRRQQETVQLQAETQMIIARMKEQQHVGATIKNDQEFQAMLNRIRYFQQQVAKLREVETNLKNYKLSAGGYLAELDRMNLEVREYLWAHPSELLVEVHRESVLMGS